MVKGVASQDPLPEIASRDLQRWTLTRLWHGLIEVLNELVNFLSERLQSKGPAIRPAHSPIKHKMLPETLSMRGMVIKSTTGNPQGNDNRPPVSSITIIRKSAARHAACQVAKLEV